MRFSDFGSRTFRRLRISVRGFLGHAQAVLCRTFVPAADQKGVSAR